MGIFDTMPPINGATLIFSNLNRLNGIIGTISGSGMVIIQSQCGKEHGAQNN